jgi:hypothetical protein
MLLPGEKRSGPSSPFEIMCFSGLHLAKPLRCLRFLFILGQLLPLSALAACKRATLKRRVSVKFNEFTKPKYNVIVELW